MSKTYLKAHRSDSKEVLALKEYINGLRDSVRSQGKGTCYETEEALMKAETKLYLILRGHKR